MEKFVCHITRGPEHPFGLLLVTIAKIPNLTEDDLKTRKVFYVRASIKPTNKQVNPLARLEGRSEDWELTFHDDNAFIAIHTLQAFFPLLGVCEITQQIPSLEPIGS